MQASMEVTEIFLAKTGVPIFFFFLGIAFRFFLEELLESMRFLSLSGYCLPLYVTFDCRTLAVSLKVDYQMNYILVLEF